MFTKHSIQESLNQVMISPLGEVFLLPQPINYFDYDSFLESIPTLENHVSTRHNPNPKYPWGAYEIFLEVVKYLKSKEGVFSQEDQLAWAEIAYSSYLHEAGLLDYQFSIKYGTKCAGCGERIELADLKDYIKSLFHDVYHFFCFDPTQPGVKVSAEDLAEYMSALNTRDA